MDVSLGTLIGQFITFIVLFIVPPLIALASKRTDGTDKLLWTVGVLLTSWLGLVVFLLVRRGG
ncbi:MAG: hypothetical protein WD397_15010 [Wenzhouxiangellaceae bacterium]